MLTDTEARDLLHAAADTIEVDPAQPLPVVHRPLIWPMLVAAGAVIAVVVTTLALADRGSSPSPSNPPTPTPDVNRMPAVMGLDLEDALDLMSERKLHVELVNKEECVSERVVAGSSPPVGAPFQPQDVVTLTVINPSPGFCVLPDAWGLLRFALDIAPPPLFADEVTLYAGQATPVTLSATEAADPDRWQVCEQESCASALRVLAERATAPSISGGVPAFTSMPVDPIYGVADSCAGGPETLAGLTAFRFSIDEPSDGVRLCGDVVVYYDRDYRIAAVGVPLGPLQPREEPVPEVVAHAFVDWARGSGTPPSYADDVDLYLGNVLQRTVSADEASTSTGLDLACVDYASRPCPGSAFEALGGSHPVVLNQLHPEDEGGRCHVVLGRLPTALLDNDALAGAVQIDRSAPTSCGNSFTVQLWLEGDEIYAVNLIYGDPCDDGGGCAALPTPDAARIGQMFVDFARGADALPVDTPVGLYLNGDYMRTIEVSEALERTAWLVCPPGAGACIRSSVDLLADPGDIGLSAVLPDTGCPGAEPPVWPSEVTLSPRSDLVCGGWAVQLRINDVGQVTAVNLVTSP